MLYFYISIHNKTLEVMVLDDDVLPTRSHLWGNSECNRSLIVFVNRYWCYWIFENATQYRQSVSLKFE